MAVDGDVVQATLLVVGFVVTLPLLIFALVRLEDSIDDPPAHLGRRLMTFVTRGGRHDAE
jgi:hypothetical protein